MEIKIKKETLNQTVEIINSCPVASIRYQQINPQWIDTDDKNEFLYDDAKCVVADIPEWDEATELSLSQAKRETNNLEQEMGEPSYDAFFGFGCFNHC